MRIWWHAGSADGPAALAHDRQERSGKPIQNNLHGFQYARDGWRRDHEDYPKVPERNINEVHSRWPGVARARLPHLLLPQRLPAGVLRRVRQTNRRRKVHVQAGSGVGPREAPRGAQFTLRSCLSLIIPLSHYLYVYSNYSLLLL